MGWINDSDDPSDPDSITYYGGGVRSSPAEKAALAANACAARFAAAAALVAPPELVPVDVEILVVGVSWLRVPYYKDRRGRGPVVRNDRRTLKGVIVRVDGEVRRTFTLSEGDGTLTCRDGAIEVQDGFVRYDVNKLSVTETVQERRTLTLRRKVCVSDARVKSTDDIEEGTYIHIFKTLSEVLRETSSWGRVGGWEPLWHIRMRACDLILKEKGFR